MKSAIGRSIVLWTLFFAICMSLGYPTLNRYDPRIIPGLSDSIGYYSLVTGEGHDAGDESHRVLVPYLAKPIYWLAKTHIHTWNPAFFALEVVNSFFLASTAYLLVRLGYRIVGSYPAALIAGFLYLTDFAVANLNLSGFVDSGVNCLLMVVTWTLLSELWWLLPLWGILGALSKETFVPLAFVLTFTWWLVSIRRGALRISRLAWIGAMMVGGLMVLTFLMSRGSTPYSPLSFAASRWAKSGSSYFYLPGLYRCIVAHEFLFTFGWLLPLGLWRLRRLPKAWVTSSTCASIAALAMGAYDDALGNAARAVFSASGPILSLSVSLLLLEIGTRSTHGGAVQERL